jgi:hypothetical protein
MKAQPPPLGKDSRFTLVAPLKLTAKEPKPVLDGFEMVASIITSKTPGPSEPTLVNVKHTNGGVVELQVVSALATPARRKQNTATTAALTRGIFM